MSHARETTLTFFIMYLTPLTSEVYLLVNLFEKPIHNAVRHFSCYIVKLGLQGYTIFFFFLLKNIDCVYSLEAVLMSTHNLCFEQKYENIRIFYLKIFIFWG